MLACKQVSFIGFWLAAMAFNVILWDIISEFINFAVILGWNVPAVENQSFGIECSPDGCRPPAAEMAVCNHFKQLLIVVPI